MKKAKIWTIFQLIACGSAFAHDGTSSGTYLQLARRGVNGQSLGVASGSVDTLPNSSEPRVLAGLFVPIDNTSFGLRAAVGSAYYETRFLDGHASVSSVPAELGLYGRVSPGLKLGSSLLTNLYQRVEATKAGVTAPLHPSRTVGVSLYGEYEIVKGMNLLAGYTHDRFRAEGSVFSYRASVDSFQLAASYRFR